MTLPYQPLRTTAQRRNALSHPKIVKKFSLAAVILLAFLFLAGMTGMSAVAGKIAGKFILYVHVARLYTKEPDQTIAMPIEEISKNQISNTWHAPRGRDRLHEGQDIFAPRGTPVLSATEGYILNIGDNNLGGQTVSVIGAGGRTYYYAHLDSYAPQIAEGDYVTRTTVLGYVGTTGNALGTPPHLHFGVYASGGAMNPLPLLTDRPSLANKAIQAKVKNAKQKTSDIGTQKTRARASKSLSNRNLVS